MKTLAVWNEGGKAGILERDNDHAFTYLPDASPELAVSLTMPVRLRSWVSRDLHPVFQMNLPEGALLLAVRHALAKIAGSDDLTVLLSTGGNQIGRNRFSLPEAERPSSALPPESLDQILAFPNAVELFNELMVRYALSSGISGIQPKVMLEASERLAAATSSWIVKSWGNDYPHLAANEFFCMTAVASAGVRTPLFHLSDNGGLFVMKRFDLSEDRRQLGFEDFCVLQALGMEQKYESTYERAAKTLIYFVSPTLLRQAQEQFFAMLTLSMLLRNGDFHLKNMGILYDGTQGEVSLAPAYDIVTTTAYLRHDMPALTLAGTKKWWRRKSLIAFGIAHLMLTPAVMNTIIERCCDSVAETLPLLTAYTREHLFFTEIAERMAAAWNDGLKEMSV